MALPYQDPTRSASARLDDLLPRMTLEEKVGQLVLADGTSDQAARFLASEHVGSFLHVMGARQTALQQAAEQTRLGIPLLFGIDAVRGHGLWKNATLFPPQLALSCTWDPSLLEAVAQATAREVRATGPQWTFSPQLDICRDIRWGRLGETFGEDPLLAGALAAAMVRGYQGTNLASEDAIASCPKHFVGYGETIGGRDATDSENSERKLRLLFFPPFRRVVEQGAVSIMAGYNTLDGVSCSLNRWLLSEVLREEWGFDGFVVSDWDNVGRALHQKNLAESIQEASCRAVEAGNDMAMATPGFYTSVLQAVRGGALAESQIDVSVRRVLSVKFRLGLFDDVRRRYPDVEKIRRVVGCPAHRRLSLEASRKSLVLLKNNDLLPLVPGRYRRIAVLGPNADDVFGQLGGWAIGAPQAEFAHSMHDRSHVVTVLDGLRARFAEAEVKYEQGCCAMQGDHRVAGFFVAHQPEGYLTPPPGGLERAVALARASDVAIVVVGDTQSQIGEMNDRADMNLGGQQMDLLRAIKQTGTPLIVVLMVSKPHTIGWVVEQSDALVCAWSQGEEGGTAVAELLAGDFNPSGKLTQSWPVSLGQQPVNYNQFPGWHADRYMDLSIEPLYAFGFGMSYTRYVYRGLQLQASVIRDGDPVRAWIEVANVGEREGMELVQVYLRDCAASALMPGLVLKAWHWVSLSPGQTKKLDLELPYEALAALDANGTWRVEPGRFELLVGPSSRTSDLHRVPFRVERASA
jgi:beta-glucosidase